MKKGSKRGFTIVELLVVIVVIGILAAITIVSYSGITARAKAARAQSNASSVVTVIEAIYADKATYPTADTATITASSSTIVKMPAGVSVIMDAATSTITATNGETTVGYACLTTCTNSTGGRVTYYDFSSQSVKYYYVGAGSSAGTFVYS